VRFKGDIQKMNTPRADRVPGTDGLFSLVIYYSESTSSIDEWKFYETAGENLTYDEALDLERARIDELLAQYKDKEL
jgi:hypothetical protein